MTKRLPKENIIYAGAWCERKGENYLAEALLDFKQEIELTTAGAYKEEVYRIIPSLRDSNVKLNIFGYLNRRKLSQLLCSHKIFIFPSLSEGSARVIFEAMANGCCILTTMNSGSIVKHKENGLIFKAGSSIAIKTSIREILSKTNKEIEEIGLKNFSSNKK